MGQARGEKRPFLAPHRLHKHMAVLVSATARVLSGHDSRNLAAYGLSFFVLAQESAFHADKEHSRSLKGVIVPLGERLEHQLCLKIIHEVVCI